MQLTFGNMIILSIISILAFWALYWVNCVLSDVKTSSVFMAKLIMAVIVFQFIFMLAVMVVTEALWVYYLNQTFHILENVEKFLTMIFS